MIKVLHIISGLKLAGAEMMLLKLVSNMDNKKFNNIVISLSDIGPIGERILNNNVKTKALKLYNFILGPINLIKLIVWLNKEKPDVVQTWMYHADLIGGLISKFFMIKTPVVWNIRRSNFTEEFTNKKTLYIAKICAKLSKYIPYKIICCSTMSYKTHKAMGYSANKMSIIKNGFDLEVFKLALNARIIIREELNLPTNINLIGLVARFHPQKDHHTFIKAAKILTEKYSNVMFILCGEDVTWKNSILNNWISSLGLNDKFILLGERNDINRITAALDIATSSSSFGEGFPNIIGESMACGIPCVVTDVGDSADIVAGYGIVVPIKNPHAIADGWYSLLTKDKAETNQLKHNCREHIKLNYDIKKIVKEYENFYLSVIQNY